MRYITGHVNTDLDALSAMIAAQKLFPDAILVHLGQMQDKVREIISLYKDIFKIVNVNEINLSQISEVIIVDANSLDRLGKLGTYLKSNPVKIQVFDHHSLEANSIQSPNAVVEQVGATTTILVEQIKKRNLKLSSLEASIIALGIYDDTGCFTNSSTTARDSLALSFLLSQGVNLNFISQYIGNSLSEEQWDLMNCLLDSLEQWEIKGRKISICSGSINKYVGGLALITNTIGELKDLPVIFTAVKMKDRIFVVGRSKIADLSVLDPIKLLGGGGHAKAASAIVKNESMDFIRQTIISSLNDGIEPGPTVKGIMSSPVKTIKPDLKLEDAYTILTRYGHTGLPVLEEGQLVGVISRRDIEKALQHQLGHAPVKAYMNRNVKFVRPYSSLDETRKIMIENDIGRLPVLDDADSLVGIVTRTDLLKHIHGSAGTTESILKKDHASIKINLSKKMQERFPPEVLNRLYIIGELADQMKTRVYMVGGIVRDLFLEVDNYDLDLVVEGDGIGFAKALAKRLKGNLKVVHERFGTAVLTLDPGVKIDIATARTEFYEYPAALPTVEYSNLKQDLSRRDFTVNTLALKLNHEDFGVVLDFFSGIKDLKSKKIRVLHNLSFVDDPTRIFRAVRFEQRYKFTIEEQTKHLITLAVEDGLLTKLSDKRIVTELLSILDEPHPEHSLQRLQELGILNQIDPLLYWNDELTSFFSKIRQGYECLTSKTKEDFSFAPLYLQAWLFQLNIPENAAVWEKFGYNREKTKKVRDLSFYFVHVEKELAASEITNSQIRILLDQFNFMEHVLLWASTDKIEVLTALSSYYNRLIYINPCLNGSDLIGLGFKQGALLGQCLLELKKNKLDGKLRSREEEISFAKDFLSKNKGGA